MNKRRVAFCLSRDNGVYYSILILRALFYVSVMVPQLIRFEIIIYIKSMRTQSQTECHYLLL